MLIVHLLTTVEDFATLKYTITPTVRLDVIRRTSREFSNIIIVKTETFIYQTR